MQREASLEDPLIDNIVCSTANEFITILRRSDLRWQRKKDNNIDDVGVKGIGINWVFRGQGDAMWNLQPSAFRPKNKGEETLLDRYISLFHNEHCNSKTDWLNWVRPRVEIPSGLTATEWNDRVGKTAIQALAHAKLIRDFVLLSDSAGHQICIPKVLWHLHNQEKKALKKLFNGNAKAIDPVFAIAQHHNIPTGLLDWTYNPLVAAYFAAEKPQGSEIAVWALNLSIVENPDIYLRRLTVPPQKIPFLDAQEGLFVWCPQAYLIHLLKVQ